MTTKYTVKYTNNDNKLEKYSDNRKILIDHLNNDIYCRLKPSNVAGVGVFAIKDIPKGINPFKSPIGCIKDKIYYVTQEDIKDSEVKKLVDDFYHGKNGRHGVPLRGLNSNDISFYLNCSQNPNVGFDVNFNCSLIEFKTLRPINKGEELFINYNDYDKL
jgi:hypothetical protein